MHVIYMILLVFILVSMLYFVSNASKGKLVKNQVIAKQTALLLDASKPGTVFTLQDVCIFLKNSKVTAGEELPYSYLFFNPFSITFAANKNTTIIRVSKK